MHIEDDPILWNDPLWSALEWAIRAIRKRPNFVLSKPDYVGGLNRATVNRLAKEAELSDRQVFEVRNKYENGRVLRRWLHVNHPGPADPIKVKVWERICPFRIPQSDIEDVIDYLRAWQAKRAKQLKPTPDSDVGASEAQQVHVKPRLTAKDRKEREQAVSTYIRNQRQKDVPIERITRDGIARATGVPFTAVSSTQAWVALAAEKKQAKAKPPPRGQSTTKDDDLLRGKAGDKIDAAIDRHDWDAVKAGQERKQRSRH